MAWSTAASSTQRRQVLMSSQSAMELLQEPPSKFGQLPMFHPIDASESSLPVPQILSSPPYFLAMLTCSLLAAALILSVVAASGQEAGGRSPFTILSLHFWSALILACANLGESLAISSLHFRASACAAVPSA